MKREVVLSLLIAVFVSVNAQNKVEKLVVYESFLRAGTTANITGAFKNPVECFVDTTNINVGENTFLSEFSKILSETSSRRHFQQKIAEISIAGEFWINSRCHFFIFCEPDLLIDMTDRKEYRITDKLLLTQMQSWIDSLKRLIENR